MIVDIIYKLARKAAPSEIFRRASYSVFGMGRDYFRLANQRGIYDYYRHRGLSFAGKRVIEVGPGSQLFTAFFFLAEGAEEVLVADPKLDPESMPAQLEHFNAATKANLGREVLSRLRLFPDIALIPSRQNGRIDLVCSHNVLEHLPDLDQFFADNARLLAPNGQSCHRVDVSDHSYHVFDNRLLSRFLRTSGLSHRMALTHLRYSDWAFRILNDPKCYMNRKLLPVYLRLIREHGFRVLVLDRARCAKASVHPDLLAGEEEQDRVAENIYLTDFFIRFSR